MTICSKFRKKMEFSDSPLPRAWKLIGKFLYRNRIHGLILVFAVVYLVISPKIYARSFIHIGKPIDVEIDLPHVSPFLRYNIDHAKEITVDNHRVYLIDGWAFLEDEPDQTIFDKYLVLNSRQQVYFFTYEAVERQRVNDHFQDLGLDILNSGFQAAISLDAVRSGKYNIGFLFKNRTNGESYYSYSNRYYLRTPNTESVVVGELPDENVVTVSDDLFAAGVDMTPLRLGTDKGIQAFVDGFAEITIHGKQYCRVAGWAFLEDQEDQSKYRKYLVLTSDQNTFYFPVAFVARPDVQEVFPELTSSLSGFVVEILEESLPQGVYEIGVIFKSRDNSFDYFTKTPWIITRTSADVTLEKK